MPSSQDAPSSKQQKPNANRPALPLPTNLTCPTTTDSESKSDSESLSEFRPLPLPMFTDAETDEETEMAADDAVAEAGEEKLVPDRASESVEEGEARDLANEIAAAVDFPATPSREQTLRLKKREEMDRENLLLDEIGAMFGPTWTGEQGESESEEER
jgi:hypothetical protein